MYLQLNRSQVEAFIKKANKAGFSAEHGVFCDSDGAYNNDIVTLWGADEHHRISAEGDWESSQRFNMTLKTGGKLEGIARNIGLID